VSEAELAASRAAFDEIASTTFQGQALRYARRFGRSSEPPLLVCNGIGANLELLAPFVAALDDRPVVTFDVPGVGGSPLPRLPYRLHHLARLADRLMWRLGYAGSIDLLGISWGGALAQQFARDHPQRCRKLVLAATSAGVLMVPGRLSVLRKLASPRRYRDRAYLRRIAAELYGGALRRDTSLVDRHIAHIEAPHGLGYFYQLGAIWGWTSLPWLHRLRQPTLVLAGNEDPIVPLINARILAHLMPQAQLQVIDDGHLFIVTSAPAVAASVASFLMEPMRGNE
jgi:poly(3-hydroxyalkanoate) depolymerase